MAAIATDTFTTSMQPYLSQHHLSRGTHLLIKTVSIGSSHTESPTGLSQVHLKQHFPCFTIEPLLSVSSPIFPSFELFKCPPKGKQDFNRFWETSLHIIFLFQRTKLPFFGDSLIFPLPILKPTTPVPVVHAGSIDPYVSLLMVLGLQQNYL